MSPELVQERPYDYTSDLWALGCILYELYAGQPPFYTNSIATLVKLVLRGNIKWPKGMGKELRTFLQGLLEKEISRRLKWPDLLYHPFLKKHIDFDRMTEIGREGQEVASQRAHREIMKQNNKVVRPPSRGEKSQTAPVCGKSQSGPITNKSFSYTLTTETKNHDIDIDSGNTANNAIEDKTENTAIRTHTDTPVIPNATGVDRPHPDPSVCQVVTEVSRDIEEPQVCLEQGLENLKINKTASVNIESYSANSTFNSEKSPPPDVLCLPSSEYTDVTCITQQPDNNPATHETHETHDSNNPDSQVEIANSNSKCNQTANNDSSIESSPTSKKLTINEIITTHESNSTSEQIVKDSQYSNNDSLQREGINSKSNTNIINKNKSDSPLKSDMTKSSVNKHSPLKKAISAVTSPSLDKYAQHSSIYVDEMCPQYEYGTSKISPRKTNQTKPKSNTNSNNNNNKNTKTNKSENNTPRVQSATDKPVPKSRLSHLKSLSLNELLPGRSAEKEKESFSRFEVTLSRIDSLFRLLIKYLRSLDISFPLLDSWTDYYQTLSPISGRTTHSCNSNIMRDLERGWEGTDLFLELTRDCLSKIRSDSPRLRSRAGERLNKLLTFQILVLVARETVSSADMLEVVRRFGIEELCFELMSTPVLLSGPLEREQLMAVFLSHELFSLLTNCSCIEWGGRIRKKLEAITNLVTRSLPDKRPPLPPISISHILIAYYPLANSLVQKGFLQLERLNIEEFIEFNRRNLLVALPPQHFSPYVTTGYLDQVFVFLNSLLKQPRKPKTLVMMLSFASSLFSIKCIKQIQSVTPSSPLGPALQPCLSPIGLMEFLTLLRDCLLQLSTDTLCLQLLSSELLKELFLSVSTLMQIATLDRLLDWYTEWVFLDYYSVLVSLCVRAMSYLLECCAERGLHTWITHTVLTAGVIPSLLKVVQYFLATQPDTDSFLPLLVILSYCSDRGDILTHLVDTIQLTEWREVPYSLFSHLLDEPHKERELDQLLKLFLQIALLYHQQPETNIVTGVLNLVSDSNNSGLDSFYQLLAHENRDIAMSVLRLLDLLIDRPKDSVNIVKCSIGKS